MDSYTRSFFKGSLIYTASQILSRSVSFLLIPIYTRYLTQAENGIMGIMLLIFHVSYLLFMCGANPTQVRYHSQFADNKILLQTWIFSWNVFLWIFLGIIVTITWCLPDTFYSHLLSSKVANIGHIFKIVITASCLNILNQMSITFYLAQRRYWLCAILQTVQFLTICSLIIFFIVFRNQGVLGRFLGMAIGEGLVILGVYYFYSKNFYWKFEANAIKAMFKFGMPIVLTLISMSLMNFADRIVLERFASIEQVGIYTIGYQFGLIMFIIVSAINQAWTPNYYKLQSVDSERRRIELNRMFKLWAVAMTICGLLIVLVSKYLLRILATPEYYCAEKIIPAIVLGYFLNGLFNFKSSPLLYLKKTSWIGILTIIAVCINLLLNIALIPKYGMMGAAHATWMSFAILLLLTSIVSRKYDNENHFSLVKILPYLVAISIPVLVSILM